MPTVAGVLLAVALIDMDAIEWNIGVLLVCKYPSTECLSAAIRYSRYI